MVPSLDIVRDMLYLQSADGPEVASAFESALSATSVIASIASLTLAIVAIWLAFKFYALSSQQAEDAAAASKDIAHSVDKLEKIFDRMYSDTFGMVQNMQERIFQLVPLPGTEVDGPPLGPGEQNKESPQEDPKQGSEESSSDALYGYEASSPWRSQLKKSAAASMQREQILKVLSDNWLLGQDISLNELLASSGFSAEAIAQVLFLMRADGEITWDGGMGTLRSSSKIRLSDERAKEIFEG